METRSTSESETRWWDPLAALLLLCALLTAAARLVVTDWTEGLELVRTLAVLGAVLGLVLGQTRFSSRAASFFALAYGLFLIPWQLGSTLAEDMLWKERILVLSNRLGATVEELLLSKMVSDNILFLFLMALLFWGFSVHAGYSLTRHANSWRALLPVGFTIIVIHSYDPFVTRRAGFLAAFLLFAILLVARTDFVKRRLGWKSSRTYIPPDISFDWIRFTLVVAVLIVMLSWTIPVFAESLPAAEEAWQQARRPWVEFQDRMSNLFGSLQASVGIYNEYYSNTFSLGLGNPLTDDPVLAIQAPPRGFPGVRFYWRAYAYDQYDNGGWHSTASSTINMGPEVRDITLTDNEGRNQATFTFTPQSPIATLFTAPQPTWVSRDATAYVSLTGDGALDVVAVEANRPVFRGDSYEVRSSIAAVTEVQLRQAGTDYPEWITDRYLQLPDEITPRTIELAQTIKGDLENPYDIAVAITEYLRTYEYSDTIEAPPLNREVVDWWLFDYAKGFCQYYATSQVVLLRALGIPARYAVGYAEGELEGGPEVDITGLTGPEAQDFISVEGTYIVRQRDSHAWPEAYFPGIGWIEFEPTGSQVRISRPSGETLDETGLGLTETGQDADELARLQELLAEQRDRAAQNAAAQSAAQGESTSWMWILLAIVVIGGGAIFTWRVKGPRLRTPLPVQMERGLRRLGIKSPRLLRRWAHFASLPPVTHYYMEINKALKRLGQPPGVDDTPAERALALAALLPEVQGETQHLIEEYQFSIYSTREPEIELARQCSKEIRTLSYDAALRNFIQKRFGIQIRRNRSRSASWTV
jgi:transglutaminase-like putative cysteine protease